MAKQLGIEGDVFALQSFLVEVAIQLAIGTLLAGLVFRRRPSNHDGLTPGESGRV